MKNEFSTGAEVSTTLGDTEVSPSASTSTIPARDIELPVSMSETCATAGRHTSLALKPKQKPYEETKYDQHHRNQDSYDDDQENIHSRYFNDTAI